MVDERAEGSLPGSAGADAERAADLDGLRERLAFYESFDQLIQDNISRAGDLLREAAAKKSETELALRDATAEIAQAMADKLSLDGQPPTALQARFLDRYSIEYLDEDDIDAMRSRYARDLDAARAM